MVQYNYTFFFVCSAPNSIALKWKCNRLSIHLDFEVEFEKPLYMTRCRVVNLLTYSRLNKKIYINPSRITSHSALWIFFTTGRGEKTPHRFVLLWKRLNDHSPSDMIVCKLYTFKHQMTRCAISRKERDEKQDIWEINIY